MLKTSIPNSSAKYKNQEELSVASEEFNKEIFEPPKFLLIHRIYQVICFILFFGIAKLFLAGVAFIIWILFITTLSLFKNRFQNRRSYKLWSYSIGRYIIQFFLFSLGIFRVRINGEIDRKTRIFVSNHVSIIDYLVHFYGNLVTFAKKEPASEFEHLFYSSIFDIFRIKNKKISYQIENCASDPMLSPLLLFPEGEPTTGDAVAHFDEELFCAKYQIQPISIQYHLYLTPPGFNSVYGNKNSIWKTLFRIVSIPFIVVDLNYLSSQQIKYEQTGKKQKAENAQLQIANNIGVIAISNL